MEFKACGDSCELDSECGAGMRCGFWSCEDNATQEEYGDSCDAWNVEAYGTTNLGPSTGMIIVALVIWFLFIWLQYYACKVQREAVFRMKNKLSISPADDESVDCKQEV